MQTTNESIIYNEMRRYNQQNCRRDGNGNLMPKEKVLFYIRDVYDDIVVVKGGYGG